MRNINKYQKYFFCVKSISLLRNSFHSKICFQEKYKFLTLKYTPTYAISNRIMKKGKFLKIYKLVKKSFNYKLLFLDLKKISISSNFLFFYKRYYSFRDSDRVFFWKIRQLDSMFRMKTKKLKKKKQQISKISFLKKKNRIPLCVNFIKYLILLNVQRKKQNINLNLFDPLLSYITSNKINPITKIKYKLYRQKLMQLQN